MRSRFKRSVRRTNDTKAMIFCCHGLVYAVTDKVLGAKVELIDGILDRLLQIGGVKVVKVGGGVANVNFPALRLPELTRVLVPLDSAWAPRALAAAARGRIR
jgi:hypothetical protein